jgi:hypothetical protein
MQVIMNEQNEIQYFIRNAHACSELRSNILLNKINLFPERNAYNVRGDFPLFNEEYVKITEKDRLSINTFACSCYKPLKPGKYRKKK